MNLLSKLMLWSIALWLSLVIYLYWDVLNHDSGYTKEQVKEHSRLIDRSLGGTDKRSYALIRELYGDE